MDIDAWARANKKRIAREFIRQSGESPDAQPVAIITAGLPGAGKTEFTRELLQQTTEQPLRIDMDEIAASIEGYKPKIADKFRAGASIIMDRIYDEVTRKNISFVLDGTFAGSSAVDNVIRAVKHGYTVKLYYIYQRPDIAWDFTKAREKIEHRSIDKQKFIESYYRIHDNISQLNTLKIPFTVSLMYKDETNHAGSLYENIPDILQRLPPIMTRIELENQLQ